MRQHDGGVGQDPAPVAGVVGAFAVLAHEGEAEAAAVAQRQRRTLRTDAWTIAGNEHVSRELVPVRGNNLGQTLRSDLLARLHHEFRVEAELPTALREHGA